MKIEVIFKNKFMEPIEWRGREAIMIFKREEDMYRFIDLNGDELLAAGAREVWVSINDGEYTIYRLEKV